MSERRKGIGRRQVIAGFFALLGLLLIFNYAPQALAGDTVVTRIALAVPQPVIAFPSAWSLTIIGFVMLIAGSLGLTNRVQRWADVSLWTSAVLLFPAILIWAAAGKQTKLR